MIQTYVAIWPTTDPSPKLPGLIRTAEDDLALMLAGDGLILTAEPTWELRDGRLVMTASVRRRAPWDCDPEDAAKAYVIDLLPDWPVDNDVDGNPQAVDDGIMPFPQAVFVTTEAYGSQS